MIHHHLLPAILARFSVHRPRTGSPPEPIVVIPERDPRVGEIRIWDEHGEATVAIGASIHAHFCPYDESLTEEQIHRRVSESVIEFLEELFSNRVMLWEEPDQRAGGWFVGGIEELPPQVSPDAILLCWSGTIPNPLQRPPDQDSAVDRRT